ncbi:MAG TPA: hypothetical protein VE135_14420 [Pyrinomonadaceae bacterium]|nr:hypothetical protein [Pyrinomonadaceae bacterium]
MSTVLPVIQPGPNGQPRTDVDFDQTLSAHGIDLRQRLSIPCKSTWENSVIRRASIATSTLHRRELRS